MGKAKFVFEERDNGFFSDEKLEVNFEHTRVGRVRKRTWTIVVWTVVFVDDAIVIIASGSGSEDSVAPLS